MKSSFNLLHPLNLPGFENKIKLFCLNDKSSLVNSRSGVDGIFFTVHNYHLLVAFFLIACDLSQDDVRSSWTPPFQERVIISNACNFFYIIKGLIRFLRKGHNNKK